MPRARLSFYIDGGLVLVESVSSVARESLHAVGRVFEKRTFNYLLDLRQQCFGIVLFVAADFVLVDADL